MRSILVGSDLGPRSDAVVRSAAALAYGSGTTLHIVHALGVVGLPLREAVTALESGIVEQAQSALTDQLDRVLAGYGVAIPIVDYRSPGPALHEQASALRSELVVVGSPHWGGGAVRGSTLRQITSTQAAYPVLVSREPFRWPPRSILLPVMESGAGADVLQSACDWLCGGLSEVPGGLHERSIELLVLDVSEAPGHAATLARAPRRAGGLRLHITTIRDPCDSLAAIPRADHVLDWAVRAGASLLLVRPHGNGWAAPADHTWWQVLHRAPCPVLLLPDVPQPAPEPPAEGSVTTFATLDETEVTIQA